MESCQCLPAWANPPPGLQWSAGWKQRCQGKLRAVASVGRSWRMHNAQTQSCSGRLPSCKRRAHCRVYQGTKTHVQSEVAARRVLRMHLPALAQRCRQHRSTPRTHRSQEPPAATAVVTQHRGAPSATQKSHSACATFGEARWICRLRHDHQTRVRKAQWHEPQIPAARTTTQTQYQPTAGCWC